MNEHRSKVKLKGWVGLSRPAFHTVGVLPFILGCILTWKIDGFFNIPIFILGILAVVMVMLATYHPGEYFDYEEDRISKKLFNNMFAGGPGVIPSGIISR